MAFRIGKSVMLYFGHNLEPLFVFIGLSFLTLIGPLLKHYIKGMITPKFSISKVYFLEFVPFWVAVILGFYVPKDWLNTKDEVVIAVFGTFIISVYLHLAFYIVIAARMLYKKKKQLKNEIKTKDQNTIMKWLNWVVLSFVIIWISYFLNILS